jgi:multiple antibiotic resistance protein
MFDSAVTAFVTLFVTIDPPGLAPVFLALTGGMTRSERRLVTTRSTLLALAILLAFALAGTAILTVFGITIHAFRIAGGLLLFYIAFEMVFEKRQERHEKSAQRAVTEDVIRNLAVFPLAIPLIAGPGAISATILLSDRFPDALGRSMLMAIILAVLAITYLVFMLAERIDGLLGETGRMVLTRLLGVILAALSVQFVADGITALIAAGATAG